MSYRIEVAEDREVRGQYRVEEFFDDGECIVSIFTGRHAQVDAEYYATARRDVFDGKMPEWR